MDKLAKGSCAQYHANAPLAYFKQIYFWKTPIAQCGGRPDELHGLHEVAAGLDPAQGLSPRRHSECAADLGGALWRRRWLKAVSLLSPPVGAFLVVYIAALVALFVTAFWTIDSFTGLSSIHSWTIDELLAALERLGAYRTIALRTIGIAAAVTVTDAIIAIPFAYFMARLAGPRVRADPLRARPAPALGELPRARLRVAADPRTTTAC